jgi:hypothetical protein
MCILCAIIFQFVSGWINFVGWIFLIPTAGYFFLTGANYYNMGIYNSLIWVIVTLITIPLVLYLDNRLIESIDWYNSKSCFAYYILYVLGYLLGKLKIWSPPRVV